MKRIYILGTSGSGKSHLAEILSKKLKIKQFDLDDIYWIKKYTKKRSEENKKKLLSEILKNNKKWIIEGNLTTFVDEAVKKADEVIWLDIHPLVMSYRVIRRSLTRMRKDADDFKGMKLLLGDIRKYKRKGGMYHKHKELLGKHKKEFILIQNKRQLNRYLKELI